MVDRRGHSAQSLAHFVGNARLHVPITLAVVAIAAGLYNYLAFHTALELFTTVVAITAFTIAWNAEEFFKKSHIEYLGAGYFWVGIIDAGHALAYRGMGVFDVAGRDVASELWIAGRAIEAAVLVSFPFLVRRRADKRWSFTAVSVVAVALVFLIAADRFPRTFVEGQGLTTFKIVGEWVIIAVLLAALVVVQWHRDALDRSLTRFMQTSIALTVAAEFCFTQYSSVFGGMNMLGHIFKLFSFWLIYVALVEFSLRRPFQAIARQADTFGAIPDPVVVVGRDGRIQQFNDAATAAFAGLDENAVGAEAHPVCHPRSVSTADCPVCRYVADGRTGVVSQVAYEGTATWRDVTLAPAAAGRSDPAALVCTFHDVTDRVTAMRELEGTVRRLRLLSECNQALTHSDSKVGLLERICDLMVRVGGYEAAWGGLLESTEDWNEGAGMHRVACAVGPGLTLPESLFPASVDRRDPGFIGQAVESAESVIVHSLEAENASCWQKEAVRHGLRTGLALRMCDEGGTLFGVFAAWSSHSGPVADDELALLREIAGDLGYGIAALRHRRERREAMEARQKEAERVLELERIIGRSPAVAFLWKDEEGWPIEFVSRNVSIFGYSAEELIERHARYAEMVHEDDLDRVDKEVEMYIRENRASFRQEYRLLGHDGTVYWVDDRTWVRRDKEGDVTHFEGIVVDISARREAEAKLEYLARFDSLTGLANRAEFEERIRSAKGRSQREKGAFAVHYLDLDHFKDVNDTLGHPVGDRLLQQVAARLRQLVRTTDAVARFGGDEFAVLQTDLKHSSAAVRLAEKIQEVMALPFDVDGNEIRVTCSIGVVVHSGTGPDATELLAQADIALYRAKAAGRNLFRFYDPQMDEEVRARVATTAALRDAVKNGELVLHYQPQVSLDTGRVVCAEALLRWHHPEHGLLSPGAFIGIAEDSGLIFEISEWVLKTALDQLQAWQSTALAGVRLAVNVSPLQFRDEAALRRMIHIIREFDGDKRLIELELTERSLMHMTKYAERALTALANTGVTISIDDFGTGYSSLAYISRYPVSRLKIAQDFVAHSPANTTDTEIVAAIINLARNLNMSCIAEGVETREQLRFLMDNGCREFQGYFFSKPVEAGDLEPLARRRWDLEGLQGTATGVLVPQSR